MPSLGSSSLVRKSVLNESTLQYVAFLWKKKAIHESFIRNLKVYKITPYFLTMNKMQAYIYFCSKVIQERLVKWERSRLENNNQSQVEKEKRKKR